MLTAEIQEIQEQLGDKQRTDELGRRLTSREYWTWRKRATHALNQKLDELRTVKNWIRDNRAGTVDDTPLAHLHRLYRILSTLREQAVDLKDAELVQLEDAGRCLQHHGVELGPAS